MYHGERFNAWTHLVGTLLSFFGVGALVAMAAATGDPWRIVSVAVFGSTLILLYGASTLYHSLRGRAKLILRKLDHLSIYLLIAGTYTPFCLITLRGAWGWSLFGVVWGLAIVGMLQEIKPRSEARLLSLLIYAVMGWVIIVAVRPLLDHLALAGFVWLACGGALYTIGIVFYAFDSRFRHWHGIWHLFVIGGSVAHYVAVAFYVI
jgi:hemolysin III